MRASVLIVDDDAGLRRILADRLRFWGHETEEAEGGPAALRILEEREFDLVLLDLAMPEMDGLEALKRMRESGCGADIVILTAHGTIDAAVQAVRAGAAEFLPKPADLELLRRIVERSLERKQLLRTNQALQDRYSGPGPVVLGNSEAMQSLMDTASRAARSNATLLITGESGTGKQVLAEWVHQASTRSEGPFVNVNCVALSDDLAESALFGHEKGAFTGAIARKEGRLEAAAGGTAFLDEIGDISPRIQTKLLRFLETNQFERVGGTRTLSVDCRLLAATNRDLEAAVRDGHFREDLFFRLNVIRLHIPPLRDRIADIALLAGSFLARYSAELGREGLRFSPEMVRALEKYPWPGNVRQLRNVVERMVVLAPTEVLTPDLLPPEVCIRAAQAEGAVPEDLTLKEAEQAFRKSYIRRALVREGWNQTRTAEALGLQRTFLNRLMGELGLRTPARNDEAARPDVPPHSSESV